MRGLSVGRTGVTARANGAGGQALPNGRVHRNKGNGMGIISAASARAGQDQEFMELSIRQIADVVIVAPTGRIDHASASALQQGLLPLMEASSRRIGGVVIDMGHVEYISSMGLRVLMVAAKQARAARISIAVAALPPVIAEIFAISRFDAVLDVHASLRRALESISQSALAELDATQPRASA